MLFDKICQNEQELEIIIRFMGSAANEIWNEKQIA
jgi:hypothetical protein